MKRDFEGKEQGFSLLELLMAVGVMAMVIVGVAALVSRQGDDAKANVVALQLKTIGDAAGEYIKDNYNTIYTNTQAANSKIIITLPMLTASGYLGADFAQGNVYNQNMCVVVRRSANSNNNLLGLVVTEGGNAIDDVTLGQIAATIGGAGGGVYSANPTMVRGALGAWTFNTNVFSGATTTGTNCSGAGNVTLAAGHPTMSIWFADGASRSASGTLYRNAVAGQPELNTMNTALLTGTAAIIPDTQIGQPCNVDPATNANVPPTTRGAIATAQDGSVVSCVNNIWVKTDKYWGNAVDVLTDLGTCDASKAGATRMVRSTTGAAFNAHPYVPYTCDGTGTWKAVAIEQNGDLNVRGAFHADGYTTIDDNMTVSGTAQFGRVWVANNSGDHNTVQVGGSHFYGSSAAEGHNTYIEQDGNVYLRGASDNNPRSIYADWLIGNYLYPATSNVVEDECTQNGAISKTADGASLSCINGHWKSAYTPVRYGGGYHVRWLGNAYQPGDPRDCIVPNIATGFCYCPPGFKPVVMGFTSVMAIEDGAGFVCDALP